MMYKLLALLLHSKYSSMCICAYCDNVSRFMSGNSPSSDYMHEGPPVSDVGSDPLYLSGKK
jgi:hypothetical protein